MLYLMLVVVFSKLSKRWWFFLLLGWGQWTCSYMARTSHHRHAVSHSHFSFCDMPPPSYLSLSLQCQLWYQLLLDWQPATDSME